jgi:hypothetical protein
MCTQIYIVTPFVFKTKSWKYTFNLARVLPIVLHPKMVEKIVAKSFLQWEFPSYAGYNTYFGYHGYLRNSQPATQPNGEPPMTKSPVRQVPDTLPTQRPLLTPDNGNQWCHSQRNSNLDSMPELL